ncbi:hypothetical protein [Leptolyngbya ohadii]|uniref:hypothetical protein n=1 Tax=Leptolyngbya ohadii TaxID=1962290 RepID=UPI001CEC6C8F|nr:hypothetical protein [Leptolyngbya ohadii]
MQTVGTPLPPEQSDEHLSPIAAKMFLTALPEHIQRALLAHSQETQYPIEMILEMAIASRYPQGVAGFLDSEAITFADCRSEYVND